MIAVLTNAANPSLARIIVDPNAINPKGTTAIDWFVPSPDGKILAVSMSRMAAKTARCIYSMSLLAAGRSADSRVQYPTGGGSLEWRADAAGFWYTRYPGPDRPAAEQHFYQQIFFHKLGDDPSKDAYVLGEGFPKVAEIQLDARFNPKLIVVTVANGDGGELPTTSSRGRKRAADHAF